MFNRTISMTLIVILTVSALSMTFVSEETEAGQIVDIMGKTMKFDLADGRALHGFYAFPGDNITITLWNYAGPEGRATVLDFNIADWYERSSGFTSNLHAEFNIVTGRTYEFWVIQPNLGQMSISFDLYDDGTSVTLDYNITRQRSSYSPDYGFPGMYENASKGLYENVTSLNENVTSLNENVTSLNENVTTLHNATASLQENITILHDAITSLRENVTTLWANLSTAETELDLLQSWKNATNIVTNNLFYRQWLMNNTLNSRGVLINQMQRAIADLTMELTQLNTTLSSLTSDIVELQEREVDLSWVESNLTSIHAQIATIQTSLEVMPFLGEDIAALWALIDQAAQDIGDLNYHLTELEDTVPDAYNDTALWDRLAQLEGQNELLQKQLDALEDDQDELQAQSPSAAVAWGALIIGLLALFVAIAVFLMKRKESPELWVDGE